MERRELLVGALVQLADISGQDFDGDGLMGSVVALSVEILGVTAAHMIVAEPSGDVRVGAATSYAAQALGLLQLELREGPSLECHDSGWSVPNVDLARIGERWPDFAAAARDNGFRFMHAFPVRLRRESVGALGLFDTDARKLPLVDLEAAQALATVTAVALLQHRAEVGLKTRNEQLNEALTSRIVIEQAKGMLAALGRTDMAQAFEHMRRYARAHNLRLGEVAQGVVDGSIPTERLIAQGGGAGS